MDSQNWHRLTQVNDYLIKQRDAGLEAFRELRHQAEADGAESVVIIFTYEYPEAMGKVDSQFKSYPHLVGTLNRYAIEDMLSYEYDEENVAEDYLYYKLQDLAWEMVNEWMIDCFQASGSPPSIQTTYYFKSSQDALEVLDLASGEEWFEKSEFETYVANNQDNLISPLSIE